MTPSHARGSANRVSPPAPGSDVATITRLFEVTFHVFGVNTDGVDAAGSLRSPDLGGNCMNWILGHLLASRNGILALLGQEPVGDVARLERYKRGSDPLHEGGDDVVPWEELTRDFEESQKRLRAGLGATTPDALARALPEDRNPFEVDSAGQMLSWLHFHESYHMGQLGLLRRVIGKGGAIK